MLSPSFVLAYTAQVAVLAAVAGRTFVDQVIEHAGYGQ